MINLLVDEAYAYDFLSILDVKKRKKIKNSKKVFEFCSKYIKSQVGKDLHEKIIKSIEYKNLLIANTKTFNGVEKARYGSISAKELDSFNLERYACKKLLQKKFFMTDVSEQKT